MPNPNGYKNVQGHGVPFTKENQPTNEQKAAGWAKKKAGKELAAALLELAFKGATESDLRNKMAKYFGVKKNEITIEMMMVFRQMEKAIQKGDTTAYKAIMERAYGMPPQEIEQHNKQSGAITITRTVISKKV